MEKKNIIVLLLIGLSLLMVGCSKTPEEHQLIVSADTLVFKGNQTLTLNVTTNNPESRKFYVYAPNWIAVSPASGQISEGETVQLTLSSYLNDPMVVMEDNLYLTTAFDDKTVKLLGLPEDYTNYTLTNKLFYPIGEDEAIMHIHNQGNTTLDYAITSSTTFASLSSSSGQLSMLGNTDITVTIDRENLLTETNPALYVSINGNVDTVPLVIEKKLLLPNDVVDAEYAKATDLLVFVAENATLNIFHPDTQEISAVALSYTPTCVSISPDGTKAVVGHDSHVTYVDLLLETVLTVNDVPCDALDIVLTNDGWTYVFPRRDQWTTIKCLNVTTPNAIVTAHTGFTIYAGVKAKLHPSGKFVYGAQNNLSPADIEKYNIQNGTAQYLYDSPYHGDYSMGGDLWFEESGERLFTRAGTVFKTSETQSQDILYNGTITLEDNYYSIAWLDQLELKKELYLVIKGNSWYEESNPPYVYVYNSDNLIYKTKRRLEDYFVVNGENTEYFDASPFFVFAHSNGTQLYVITKAVGSGLLHEWAIQVIDLSLENP
jgi:hypothetical protein